MTEDTCDRVLSIPVMISPRCADGPRPTCSFDACQQYVRDQAIGPGCCAATGDGYSGTLCIPRVLQQRDDARRELCRHGFGRSVSGGAMQWCARPGERLDDDTVRQIAESRDWGYLFRGGDHGQKS